MLGIDSKLVFIVTGNVCITVSYPERRGYERKPVVGMELTFNASPSTVQIPIFFVHGIGFDVTVRIK